MADKLDIAVFHTHFNKEIKEIRQDTSATNEEKHARALRLKTEIEGVTHLLPSYQQLQYSQELKTLLESFEQPVRTRRFKFSERAKIEKPQRLPVVNNFEEAEIRPTLTDKSEANLTVLEKTSLITEIKHSLINIPDASSVTLKHITDSIIVIKSSGPVFIHHLTNCIVFVECHQLRIHDTKDTKFSAKIVSGRGVIERCSGLQFQGIEIDDFDSPGGQSTNYKIVSFNDDFKSLKDKLETETLEITYINSSLSL